MNSQDKNLDVRLWPNVLALNEQIFVLNQKIEACQVEAERITLRQKRDALVSKRYDQIQFNKEMFKNETKAV